jgi:heterodisulfide reductase subunit C
MLTSSIVMMLSSVGMALYLRTLAVFTGVARLNLFGAFKKLLLHFKRGGRRILPSTEGLSSARTALQLTPIKTFNHAERTAI